MRFLVFELLYQEQKMQERKVELQDESRAIDPEQEVGITAVFFNKTFVGGEVKNRPISDEVLAEIAKEHPGAYRKAVIMRNDGKKGRKLTALKKEHLFLYMRMMQERGVRLK